MNILLFAPQPFYQERGTPIAVNLLLKTLVERGDSVDLLTYHEGSDVEHKNSRIFRAPIPAFIKNVRPGFSWKKVVCDFFLFFSALRLVNKNNYQVIHAVEESVYIALVFKLFFRIPYVYDMDSSLAQQLIEKYPFLKYAAFPLNFFEKVAVKNASAVIPVCEALAQVANGHNAAKIVVLEDISLLAEAEPENYYDFKTELGFKGTVILYVGNLEVYQGIDLLLESFARVPLQTDQAQLVIVGGAVSDIKHYESKAVQLGIKDHVSFLGPKPVDQLGIYLAGADILVSPRTRGNNTPMKIYSYLHSGKPIVATDLATHTQVLNRQVAILAAPEPEGFSRELQRLIKDESLRKEIGNAGRQLAEERFSYRSFASRLNGLYDELDRGCGPA